MVRRELCKSMGALLIFGVREVEGEETCQKAATDINWGGVLKKKKYLSTGCTINAEWEALISLYNI
jgi:hypothetical protein